MLVWSGSVCRAIVLAALCVATMGASCAPRMRSPLSLGGPPAPAVLTPTSTAAQIVAAVNANTARISTYQADQASFSSPGLPGLPLLSGKIAVERPKRFRLRATTRLTGPEVDAGGNEQRFWFWARRNDPPGLYTASYSDLAATGNSASLDPTLLIDALGLITIDANAVVQGPFQRGADQVEVQIAENTLSGPRRRVLVVERTTAWPIEQQIYDSRETLIASVSCERFEYDPATGASLPRRVTLRMPRTQMSLQIETGRLVLNAPIAGGDQLWSMPTIAGAPIVDLTRGAFQVSAVDPATQPVRAAAGVATPFADEMRREVTSAAAWSPAANDSRAAAAAIAQQPTRAGLPAGGIALPSVR
ncbi:hypothetical protein [Botrimarina hoheduenensis]|nr:hypothetical protein [Botrimarina hoheduenensis]